MMHEHEHEQFAHVLLSTLEMLGNSISETLLDSYWNAFKTRCTLQEFTAACESAALEETFPLKPAMIVSRLKGQDKRQSALEAWSHVQAALSGGYHDFEFGNDPRGTVALAAVGGYKTLKMQDQRYMSGWEKKFKEAYESFSQEHVADEYAALEQQRADLDSRLTDQSGRHGRPAKVDFNELRNKLGFSKREPKPVSKEQRQAAEQDIAQRQAEAAERKQAFIAKLPPEQQAMAMEVEQKRAKIAAMQARKNPKALGK